MPSQEDYLDNLLKGIGNTEEEENSRKESEEGVKDETLQDPQIDMSDMDDLLQSALEAQQRDIPETQQSQNTQNSETIHPEETSSMSEDEIDRLLQQSREQAGSTEQQKEPDTNENDDLIKMLENVDDESLSNVLDQMAPNTENAEEPEKEEKRGKRKSFFDRFKKKKAKNSKNSAADETEYESLSEDMTEPDSGETQTTADTQKMKDDDREALLPGAFPQTEDAEHTEQDNDGTDVMDILKAAGADIVDDASQKEEKKGFFSKLLDLFTEEDEEDEAEVAEERDDVRVDVDAQVPREEAEEEDAGDAEGDAPNLEASDEEPRGDDQRVGQERMGERSRVREECGEPVHFGMRGRRRRRSRKGRRGRMRGRERNASRTERFC